MNSLNSRLLKTTLEPLRQKQRYLSNVYDFYLREANKKNLTIDEVLDLKEKIID